MRRHVLLRFAIAFSFLSTAACTRATAQEITDAARRNDAAAVQRLLEQNPRAAAITDSGHNTALHHAASLGNVAMIQVLLKYHADVNARDINGWTTLITASTTGHEDAMELLWENGADLDARSNDGNAAIHFAAKFGAIGAINFLLQKGVDVDLPNIGGNTPLAVAAWYGQVGIGQFLIACGADLKVKNKFGNTALDEANRGGQAAFAGMLTNYSQWLEERATRDLARQTSGLNLRPTFATWADRSAATNVVYREDFRAGTPGPEWKTIPLSSNAYPLRISATPIGARKFLGEFGNQEVRLTLPDLPDHKEIAIQFDLFIIRSMDGNLQGGGVGPDYWSLSVVDGPTLIHTTFANLRAGVTSKLKIQAYPGEYPGDHNSPCEGALEVNTLGYKFKNEPDQSSMDSVYRMRFTFANSSKIILFRFGGSNMQEADDESWGITNVQVAVAIAPRVKVASGPATPRKLNPKPSLTHAAPYVTVRRPAPQLKERASPRRPKTPKPAPKVKAKPAVKRIHDKKVAPKP